MKNSKPNWLPSLLVVSPWRENTYEILYKIFQQDLMRLRPIYKGKKIFIPREKEDDKEKIFWHLTSKEDKQSGGRLPDLRRAERLHWIKPLIENTDKPEVIDWDYEEGDKTIKTYIWLKNYDFIVIMKRYSNEKRLLITAFYIEHNHMRNKLWMKYKNRIQK